MPPLNLKPIKTIKKNYRAKTEDIQILNRPSILRSQSLPNNSEINFEKNTIESITNLNRSSSEKLSSSISHQQNTEADTHIYTSLIINQIIDLNNNDPSSENTDTPLSGAEED